MRQLILFVSLFTGIQAQAQWAVTVPTLEAQTITNHVEQMQQAATTYQSLVSVQTGIEKGVEAVEKVNTKLMTIRDVQEIANRTAMCLKHIQKTYNLISEMQLDPSSVTQLLGECTQCTRECVSLSAYGAKIFTNSFLKMSDKERLDETRRLLDDMDKLLARVNYANMQARAIKFNNQMINAYFQ